MRYPSVTTVLGCYVDLQNIPPERLELATKRGTIFHDRACVALLDEWIPQAAIPAEIQGYWDSFLIFKEEMIEITFFVEKEIYCPCYQFIGHPDWAGILKGDDGAAVVDWKTPIREGATWRAQVASYWHLVDRHGGLPEGVRVKRCGSLMLSPKGHAPKLKEYTQFQPRYFNDFLLALGAWRAFN